METITENRIRHGNLTSSEIFNLMSEGKAKGSIGKPFYTYVGKKNLERKLGRSIGLNKGSNSTRWGNFLEMVVNSKIGTDYELLGDKTFVHPEHSFWVGSPDTKNTHKNSVGDIKCYEPENFAEYLDVLLKNDIELFKDEYPKEFWQLVSNACILGVDNIEAIVYMPYKSEIESIRDMASNYQGADQWKYRFIVESPIYELPYLPDGNKYYKDLNIIQFEVPKEYKMALTERVLMAKVLLINA